MFLRVARDSLDVANLHPTALVLQKAADGYLSIQGRTPVAWSERHRCWELFRVSLHANLCKIVGGIAKLYYRPVATCEFTQ